MPVVAPTCFAAMFSEVAKSELSQGLDVAPRRMRREGKLVLCIGSSSDMKLTNCSIAESFSPSPQLCVLAL